MCHCFQHFVKNRILLGVFRQLPTRKSFWYIVKCCKYEGRLNLCYKFNFQHPTHNILYFLLATFHSTLPEIKLTFKSQFIAKYVQYYKAFALNFYCFWCILIKYKLLGGLNCILLEQYNCFSERRQGSAYILKNIHPSIHLFLIIKFRKLHPPK